MSEAFYKKPMTGLLLLAGAAGGPYMLLETEAGKQATQGASQLLGTQGTAAEEGTYFDSQPANAWYLTGREQVSNALNTQLTDVSLQQTAIHSLTEVLRFDMTPAAIFQKFPRVTTVLAETQLDGLRVPLVTGTNPSDIAGTLTYYFDRYQRLQRVTIHGITGDPTRFLAELQQSYHLQQQPSLGGSLYLLTWNGRPTSLAYVSPAPVIYADSPYSRFNVLIEINQQGLEYGMSAEGQHLLQAGKEAQRW
jgi:hypothetical protein